MKKQTNLPGSARKLTLNKKTISNLRPSEMEKIIGGAAGTTSYIWCYPGKTRNGNTCHFHKTCYIC